MVTEKQKLIALKLHLKDMLNTLIDENKVFEKEISVLQKKLESIKVFVETF